MKKYIRKLLLSVSILCFLFTLSSVKTAQAQSNDADSPSLYEQLQALFQDDALSFGALLQSQAEVHWNPDTPGQNTFRIPTARLKVYGNLDDNFSYTLQADVTNNPAILDANISYASDGFAITAGAQKPGISAEFLTPASATDFVNRSRVVSALVQRRDIGLKALLALSPTVYMTAGMFNGTNQKLENSNNSFYYTGRLVFHPDIGEDNALHIGINAARSTENGTLIGNGFLPAVNGKRTVYGGDVRLEVNRLLVSSELLLADLDYTPDVSDHVTGYHITAGYWATPKAQLLVRLDHLQSDVVLVNAENLLLAGLNYNCTENVSFQFNYQINPEDAAFAHHLWLAQVQVAF